MPNPRAARDIERGDPEPSAGLRFQRRELIGRGERWTPKNAGGCDPEQAAAT